MNRQIEVLPGAHLVASAGGVLVVVAHRSAAPVTYASIAGRTMTALLGIVRQVTIDEPRRSGRTVARLATNWLMSLAGGDEDEVEFGVLTPTDTGIAVFLHGGVSAVLDRGARPEVLRGREAGFTVDRVVTPAPAVGVGLFVDESGLDIESLPARGVFALTEGTAPGSGAVLWFGAEPEGVARTAGGERGRSSDAAPTGGGIRGAGGQPHATPGLSQGSGAGSADPRKRASVVPDVASSGAQQVSPLDSGQRRVGGIAQAHGTAAAPVEGAAPNSGAAGPSSVGVSAHGPAVGRGTPQGDAPGSAHGQRTPPDDSSASRSGTAAGHRRDALPDSPLDDRAAAQDSSSAGLAEHPAEVGGSRDASHRPAFGRRTPADAGSSQAPGANESPAQRGTAAELASPDIVPDGAVSTEHVAVSGDAVEPAAGEGHSGASTGASPTAHGSAASGEPAGGARPGSVADDSAGVVRHRASSAEKWPGGGSHEGGSRAGHVTPISPAGSDAPTEYVDSAAVGSALGGSRPSAPGAGDAPTEYVAAVAGAVSGADERPTAYMPPAGGGDGSAQGGAPQDIVAADERPTSYPPSAGGGERGVQGDSGPQDSVAADEPVSQRPSASVTPPRLVKPSTQSQTGPQEQLGSGPVRFGGAVSEIDMQETVVPTSARTPHRADAESRGPGVVVKGFKCARDHLNDPRVSFCAVCGIRMDQLTCVLTDGVRPPLGLLLLDDGTSLVLDSDCVLGREPEHAPAVARGAHPVRLEDRSGGMSRAHAEIRLVDWDVTVVDGGSTNGTHIRQPGHQDWSRAIPGHPVKLIPGAQVQLGSRTVTFDSQHGQL